MPQNQNASQQMTGLLSATPKKASNKTVQPVQPQPAQTLQADAGQQSGAMQTTAMQPTSTDGGQQQYQQQPYNPRSDSLVENRMTGLLDPNSDLMRRSIANSQSFSASRGLQSSSIAAGAGQAAMIDRALPIAQQDAQTHSQADQLGWQHNFQGNQNQLDRTHQQSMQRDQQQWQSGENALGRDFQRELQHLQHQQSLGLLDAQGQQRLKEMEFQQSWQSGENSANRQFQEQMQHLQHQQSLGLLDAQGQQQLQQMERNSQLTQERDRLLQQFQSANMDKQYLQQLELTSVQFEQSMNELSVRLSADQDMQMRNSMTQLQSNYLAQVGMIMSNPNFTTPEQIGNALESLQSVFNSQQSQLQAVWGFVGEGNQGGSAQPTPLPEAGLMNPNQPLPGGGQVAGPLPRNTERPTPTPQPVRPVTNPVRDEFDFRRIEQMR